MATKDWKVKKILKKDELKKMLEIK